MKAHEEIRSSDCENVLNPPQCKASDMLSGMEHWEQLGTPIAKGRTARKESSRTASSWACCRKGVHWSIVHMYLNSQSCTSYAVMCNEGSMGKGQGIGKGKDGKATGKVKGMGTEKQDSAVKFDGYCSSPNFGKCLVHLLGGSTVS